jgi:hypothetical protein
MPRVRRIHGENVPYTDEENAARDIEETAAQAKTTARNTKQARKEELWDAMKVRDLTMAEWNELGRLERGY